MRHLKISRRLADGVALTEARKNTQPLRSQLPFTQKTVPGRVRVHFAQNGGHEKVTRKAQTLVFLDRRGPRKSHGKATKKPRKSNE